MMQIDSGGCGCRTIILQGVVGLFVTFSSLSHDDGLYFINSSDTGMPLFPL